MKLIEVNTEKLARDFIEVNVELYKNDEKYIRPLDKDINEVFDESKNKTFRFGEIIRWILLDNDGRKIGRIAAFTNKRYKNKGDTQRTGGFGFFDCINDQDAANKLLNAARDWLKARGMEAMDGPINFGERDRWWGLVVDGYYEPMYCMNYNFPYYVQLLENYGCQVFYYQNCYAREVRKPLSEKFFRGHARFKDNPDFEARRPEMKNLDKFAEDFATVYNAAWASHEGNKQMAPQAAVKMFRSMKPIMDRDLVWIVYDKNEPVAMYISIPDLNQAFKHLNGQFGLWSKIKFMLIKMTGQIKKMNGIVFGVSPKYHGQGLDYYMIVEAAKIIQHKVPYRQTELQWMGDFNPKINNVAANLEFDLSRRLATYRYLFDREKEFKRHPIL